MEVIFREKSDIDCDSTGNIIHLGNNQVPYEGHRLKLLFTIVPGWGRADDEYLVEVNGTLRIDCS